ncbi:AAA family ATPase [Streptomyces sp. AC602_WCS936]|uniref:AAA family ATPase n=1 Tax=Streptomyces sp. AC602_WCS936 TaxID=2823685 RepID=UPI0027E48AFD|nr:AAA family ATPase [Streptomyces sp. AC602_WCS936]
MYGAFGSGKTTLVAQLRDRVPTALVFDPESVGELLGGIVTIPLWRTEVAAIAAGLVLQYRRPLLVPMTLLKKEYVAEIFGLLDMAAVRVEHFFVDVPAEVLAARIDARTEYLGDPEAEAADPAPASGRRARRPRGRDPRKGGPAAGTGGDTGVPKRLSERRGPAVRMSPQPPASRGRRGAGTT